MPLDYRPLRAAWSSRIGLAWALKEPTKFNEALAPRIVHEILAQRFFAESWQQYMPAPESGGQEGPAVPKQYRLEARVYAELEKRAKAVEESDVQYFNAILLAELYKRGFDPYRATALLVLTVVGASLGLAVSIVGIGALALSAGWAVALFLALVSIVAGSFGLQFAGRRVKPQCEPRPHNDLGTKRLATPESPTLAQRQAIQVSWGQRDI